MALHAVKWRSRVADTVFLSAWVAGGALLFFGPTVGMLVLSARSRSRSVKRRWRIGAFLPLSPFVLLEGLSAIAAAQAYDGLCRAPTDLTYPCSRGESILLAVNPFADAFALAALPVFGAVASAVGALVAVAVWAINRRFAARRRT